MVTVQSVDGNDSILITGLVLKNLILSFELRNDLLFLTGGTLFFPDPMPYASAGKQE